MISTYFNRNVKFSTEAYIKDRVEKFVDEVLKSTRAHEKETRP